MPAILAVLTLVLFGTALGRRVLRASRVRFDSFLDEICFSAGVGLGIFSLLVMAAGLLGAFQSVATKVGLLVLSCLLIPDAAAVVIGAGRRALRRRPAGWFQWVLAAVILVSLVCGFVSSLAPPTAWDATASHLKIPLQYLVHGGICRLDDIHSNGPLNGVMLFIPLIMLGGDAAPALLNFAFMIGGGLALLAISRRALSRTGAFVAAAIYFLMPLSAVLGSEAVVDFPVIFYVVLAFAALLWWWEDERPSGLKLAAVCLGFALGTKYTGLYALAIVFVLVAAKVLAARGRRKKLLAHGAVAVLIAVVVGCPWYVRNAGLTGNPFYPVFARVIPTRHISAALTGRVQRPARPRKYPADFLNFALFPVNHTLGFSRGIEGGPRPEGVIHSPGPLLLALVPLLVFVRPRSRWAILCVAFFLCSFVLIVPRFPLVRYLLPFLVPCAAVAGYVFDRLSERAWARRVLCVIITAVLVVQMVPFAGRAATRMRVVAGLESRAEYLLRTDDVYPMAQHAAGILPPDAKVLYVGHRVYYFLEQGIDATMGMPLRQAGVDFPAFRNPAELLERLRELGYTHVIANEGLLAARGKATLELLHELRGRGLEPVATVKDLVLYEITRHGPGSN